MEQKQAEYWPSLPARQTPEASFVPTRTDVKTVLRNSFGFVEASCIVCSRTPAIALTLRQEVGLLVVRQTQRTKDLLCREHGARQARRTLARTMLSGWWGFISFFANLLTIAVDIAAWRKYNQLLSPQGIAVYNPTALARRPMFGSRRNQLILIGVALGLLAAGMLVVIVTRAP